MPGHVNQELTREPEQTATLSSARRKTVAVMERFLQEETLDAAEQG